MTSLPDRDEVHSSCGQCVCVCFYTFDKEHVFIMISWVTHCFDATQRSQATTNWRAGRLSSEVQHCLSTFYKNASHLTVLEKMHGAALHFKPADSQTASTNVGKCN